jgi:hypothetical protein
MNISENNSDFNTYDLVVLISRCQRKWNVKISIYLEFFSRCAQALVRHICIDPCNHVVCSNTREYGVNSQLNYKLCMYVEK